MKKIFIVLFLLLSSNAFPQVKYLIYFKDKGLPPARALKKSGSEYREALSLLSERCIMRREKVMGKDHIITFEDIPLDKNYLDEIANHGVKIENKLRWFNAVSAYLTGDQLTEVSGLSFVKKVVPVKVLKINPPPVFRESKNEKRNSVQGSSDYGGSYTEYALSGIPPVHSKGFNGQGVIIGILDNGFMWKKHESLADRNVLAEYNFVFHDTSTAPQTGDSPESGIHGTFVFSLIGGYKNGFIIGPAYNASFILAKTEDDRSESHVEEDNYAAALQWMESVGVDITTSSLGYSTFDDTTYSYTYKDLNGNTTICTKALNLAFERGVSTFNAAGNEGDKSWHYVDAPADAYKVIAVGAVDQFNFLAAFSSRGPTYDGRIKPEVTAMGVNNYGASAGGYSNYSVGSGTSFATPIAAGIGAMLLSAYPYLTNEQIRQIILETAGSYIDPDNNHGYGLISAERAVGFPNLDSNAAGYKLNKIFFANGGLLSSTAKLHYILGNSPEISISLSSDGSHRYGYEFTSVSQGESVKFYYTFQDSTGGSNREPASGFYSFSYGSKEISFVQSAPVTVSSDSLEDNFPNPFNNTTTIYFNSASVQDASLIIMDGIGQKVKSLFRGSATKGRNIVSWDGISDNGIKCASGVYFALLRIGGKDYMKKIMILR